MLDLKRAAAWAAMLAFPAIGLALGAGGPAPAAAPAEPGAPVAAPAEVAAPDDGHGPDPAPPGVDYTKPAPIVVPATADRIYCDGNGTSGHRVKAIYAVASDRPNRADEVVPAIPAWAGTVERVFSRSAEKTGGVRHVRWVHSNSASCALDVDTVVLSPAGDNSFAATQAELRAMGYTDPTRKYMVWVDATALCGIAQMYPDDSASQANDNNGRYSMMSRIDSGCWGFSDSVEAHELMHNLGGVQNTSPNSSKKGHCVDESDRMCYRDGGKKMKAVCTTAGGEALFDCNNDDYFNTNPAAGSYLATRWNAANSRFLVNPSTTPLPAAVSTLRGGLTKKKPIGYHWIGASTGAASVQFKAKKAAASDFTVTLSDGYTPVATGRGTSTFTLEGTVTVEGQHLITVEGPKGAYTLTVTRQ
ncbi:MAG: hypothetical protein ACKVWR_04945 [Acidimicrobiales bacterium]